MANGVYSGFDPVIAKNSITELHKLRGKGKTFLSAVLLFRSNSGPYVAINQTGPQLSEKEILSLKTIRRIRCSQKVF
jgi:hypothetical protein